MISCCRNGFWTNATCEPGASLFRAPWAWSLEARVALRELLNPREDGALVELEFGRADCCLNP